MEFQLVSPFQPGGDQPQAIEALATGLQAGRRAQVLMGVLFGTLGLLLATPLAACAMVIVQMLYIGDALGDKRFAESDRGQRVRNES